jgi:hypothetical protein
MGCMSGLAKVVRGTIAILRFPGVVRGTIASLISKQAIPYRTRGGTCCLGGGGSTPMNRSLADSSMTNHKP